MVFTELNLANLNTLEYFKSNRTDHGCLLLLFMQRPAMHRPTMNEPTMSQPWVCHKSTMTEATERIPKCKWNVCLCANKANEISIELTQQRLWQTRRFYQAPDRCERANSPRKFHYVTRCTAAWSVCRWCLPAMHLSNARPMTAVPTNSRMQSATTWRYELGGGLGALTMRIVCRPNKTASDSFESDQKHDKQKRITLQKFSLSLETFESSKTLFHQPTS